jgi:hypothetical protein
MGMSADQAFANKKCTPAQANDGVIPRLMARESKGEGRNNGEMDV